MGDPFLNYFALFLLVFVVVVLFYGIIAIHDIPAKIAESRNHPHQDAIHAAGWVSLFTQSKIDRGTQEPNNRQHRGPARWRAGI